LNSTQNSYSTKPIYYLIDYTCDCETNTGVQRVTRSLAKAFIEQGREILFVRWDEPRQALRIASQDEIKSLELWNGPVISAWRNLRDYPTTAGKSGLLHESSAEDLKGGWLLVTEVTHITSLSHPPTHDIIHYAKKHEMNTAFVFYDAIPLKLKEYAEMADKHAEYIQHISLADLLLPISHYSAGDLRDYYCDHLLFDDKTLPAIVPVPLAGELPGLERIRIYAEPLKKDSLILCVGTIEPRKNQTTLLDAFQRLCEKVPELQVRLVLAGNLHPAIAPQLNGAIAANPRIQYLKYVDDEKLERLYQKALFTVYPSTEEGFGLPIIESLWHGKPSLCANFGAMAEAAEGGGCLTVDVRSTQALQEALSQLLFDAELRSRLGQEAVTRQIKTWNDYAQEVAAALAQHEDAARQVGTIYYLVDHTCTFPHNTGIQRVTRMLGKSLEDLNIPVQMVKWDHQNGGLVHLEPEEKKQLSLWNGPQSLHNADDSLTNISHGWLFIPELTTYAGGDFLQKIINYARENNCRVAVIFYDAIPHKLAEIYPIEASRAHREYMRTLGMADRVFCISESAKNDLLHYLQGLDTHFCGLLDKIIPCTLSAEFMERHRVDSYKADDNSEKIKILSVGTIEPRKNHKTLIEAFNRLCKEHPRKSFELQLVGGSPFPELAEMVVEAQDHNPAIRWIREIDDAALSLLYEACHFTVYSSFEEGFGLPIAESLWYAKPCICHDQGALAEVAQGGGCVMIDMHNVAALKKAMAELSTAPEKCVELAEQAIKRPVKTWLSYAREITKHLVAFDADLAKTGNSGVACPAPAQTNYYKPLLSICITTYNRARWLSISLDLIMQWTAPYRDIVEVVVCDNASNDETTRVAEKYQGVDNFRYCRNEINVGMLGNLRVTTQHASGQYVWLVGDDDLILGGTLERILEAILAAPRVALVYLNYAYTTQELSDNIHDLKSVLSQSTPIVPPSPDRCARVREIASNNENFFTAIYTCVFRRDHALLAYSQNTEGRPFSSLLTCVPTTYHVCNRMFDETGYWIGEPALVVNMNVSWGRYAALWRLERLPEIYDLAESRGALPMHMDKWRAHNLQDITHYLNEIYFNDKAGNLPYFSIDRFILRHKHLEAFRDNLGDIKSICQKAFEMKRFGPTSPSERFSRFNI